MFPLFLILFFGLPISTVSVVANLGSAGRYGYWSSTPRQECEIKYPGMGTSAVSTKHNSINNLATWSDRGGTCGNVAIDTTASGEMAGYHYCSGCPSTGCGLYCYADITTCADTQIPNSIAHESSGSIKAITGSQLIKEVDFECKPGFFKVGAVGGQIICTGTTWTQSQCIANLPSSELNPNVFLFTNYDGGQLNIVVDKDTGDRNIYIGVVSYAAVQVVVSGSYAHNVAKVRVSAFTTAGSTVNGGTITSLLSHSIYQIGQYNSQYTDPYGNAKLICMYSGTDASQGGCAAKGQTVAAFDTAFGNNVQRIQCQYATWGGKTFKIVGNSLSDITPMTCPGSNCPPRGCPTDTPTYGGHPTCSSFSSNSCGAGKHLQPNPSSINCNAATCTINKCCESNPTCGMLFNQNKCGVGKTMKSNSSGIVCVDEITCTVAECCQICPAGKIQKEDECQECVIGKYNGRTGMTSCVDCESGTFADTPGSSFCSKLPSCTPGSRKNAVQTSTDYCTSCIPGQFSSSSDAAVCKTCPIGFSQPNTASTYCIVSSFFFLSLKQHHLMFFIFFYCVKILGLFSGQKTTQHRKYDMYKLSNRHVCSYVIKYDV